MDKHCELEVTSGSLY